ncbi:MAG: hypothetical protein HGA19_08240, partial [Oscillochloris sp.]|nr:hypothetical protein [Oscillochloris sp.]
MRTLPPIARCYLMIISVSAVAVAVVLFPISGVLLEQFFLTAACLAAMILADYSQVNLEMRAGQKVSLTVGEAVAIFSISALGTPGASPTVRLT